MFDKYRKQGLERVIHCVRSHKSKNGFKSSLTQGVSFWYTALSPSQQPLYSILLSLAAEASFIVLLPGLYQISDKKSGRHYKYEYM